MRITIHPCFSRAPVSPFPFISTLLLMMNLLLSLPGYAQSSTPPPDPARDTATGGPSTAKAMLVVDASGSMWGRLEGEPKIVIARRVINDMVNTWRGDIELGLMAYGHRQKGDCQDIETLIPVAPLDSVAFIQQVERLNPRGKTPISAAVLQAAEQLRHSEDPATVILISDGLETCDADPCALGQQLAASGVDFTVHVVGFGLQGEDTSALQCLAESTGGLYLGADDADQLQAATSTAVARVEEKASPQGLELAATLGTDTDVLDSGVRWEVREAGKQAVIASHIVNATPFFSLPPGDYDVTARHGLASHSRQLTVQPREITRATLVLNAGDVTMKPVAKPGGAPVDNKVTYWIYPIQNGQRGQALHQISSGPGTPVVQTFHLAAGDYAIVTRAGPAQVDTTVTVRDGQQQTVEVILGTGQVTVTALDQVGGEALQSDLYFWAYARQADGSRGAELARWGVGPGSTATPTFTLQAGPARIGVRWGHAYAERDVDIRADEIQQLTIPVNGARVTVKAVPRSGAPHLNQGLFYWVYRANADGSRGDEVARWGVGPGSTPTPDFILGAGDYFIGVRHKASDSYVEQAITVAAGQHQTVELVIEAAGS